MLHVNGAISATDKADMKLRTDQNIAVIEPFAVNMTPDERKKGYKMGSGREGYGLLALDGAKENPEIIPADFPIEGFEGRVTLHSDLRELIIKERHYLEMLEDTEMAVGMDMMQEANRLYKQVKISSQYNTALDGLREELAKQFKKQGKHKEPSVITIPAGSTVELKNVVPYTRIINLGNATVECKAGNELATKVKKMEVAILTGGNSLIVPKWHTSLIVTNKSATDEAVISAQIG
jgi:hypothetical protein